MLRTTPPFRADHVGSLLRPAPLKEARALREKGEITADQLRQVEDNAIVDLIAKEEAVGLQSITDGEFRREFWHFDFLGGLDGVELYDSGKGIKFKGADTKPKSVRITGKIGFTSHPMIEHFRFLKDQVHRTPKMTIPSPGVLHYRGGRAAVPEAIYPSMDAFYEDLGEAYRKAVNAFADAGCRYLQIDDTPFTYFCDPEQRKMLQDRGDNPDRMAQAYARMINTAVSDISLDITHHYAPVLRGNWKSPGSAREATNRSRTCSSIASTCTDISWSMTAIEPAASSLCVSCRNPKRWCWGW